MKFKFVKEIFQFFKRVGKSDDIQEDLLRFNENALNKFKNKDLKLKKGKGLWIQQLKILLMKRLIIFYRRYLLLSIILFLPAILELLIAFLVPSSSGLLEEKDLQSKQYGSFELDINKYGSNEIPYATNKINQQIIQLFESYYSYLNRPKINLLKVNGSVEDFVFEKHTKSINSLVKEFYFGMSWRLYSQNFVENINDCEIVGYYSRMAYHTPGVIVNEISNLILTFLNKNRLDKRIHTINSPIISNDSRYNGNDFLKYIGCFDILPMSTFNFAISLVLGFVISKNIFQFCLRFFSL